MYICLMLESQYSPSPFFRYRPFLCSLAAIFFKNLLKKYWSGHHKACSERSSQTATKINLNREDWDQAARENILMQEPSSEIKLIKSLGAQRTRAKLCRLGIKMNEKDRAHSASERSAVRPLDRVGAQRYKKRLARLVFCSCCTCRTWVSSWGWRRSPTTSSTTASSTSWVSSLIVSPERIQWFIEGQAF